MTRSTADQRAIVLDIGIRERSSRLVDPEAGAVRFPPLLVVSLVMLHRIGSAAAPLSLSYKNGWISRSGRATVPLLGEPPFRSVVSRTAGVG